METKGYLNEDGFAEFTLSCGCITTHIDGFGWSTIMCDYHQEESEYTHTSHKSLKFNMKENY